MFETGLFSLKNIKSDYDGFAQIAHLASGLEKYEFSIIKVDLSQTYWCDGNMCAPLGSILYRASRDINEINFEKIAPNVEAILCKNGFLTNYGRKRLSDTYGSTIQYKRFEPQEDRVFSYYLEEQFRNKALPEMSKALHKKFLESLMEIFSNAVIHSETEKGIFVCGQYYPSRHKLDFTIADLGIGICQNISNKIGLNFSPEKAIDWAMAGKNTTKRGRIPGGLGLKLLREFISMNQGKLQIISDRGYWELDADNPINMRLMNDRFPGTVVNLEINTADKKSYILSSEKKDEIPF